jgi:hypothetical protein
MGLVQMSGGGFLVLAANHRSIAATYAPIASDDVRPGLSMP